MELKVERSRYLVLLLTQGIFSRPWCLIEIVTAMRASVPILPVLLAKPGNTFTYPDQNFYIELAEGRTLDKSSEQMLTEHDITLDDVAGALQHVFLHIALPYSP